MMNEQDLQRAGVEYERLYGIGEFYALAREIIQDHPLQASVIILATWNTPRFRYITNNAQNLIDLKTSIEECKEWFQKMAAEEFQTVDFDKIGDYVKKIYSSLSKVKGAEYTGASKIMHLFNPRLFLIWDAAMREHYGYFGSNTQHYLDYHKRIQAEVKAIKWNAREKTLPKAIDEYHYLTITKKRNLY